MLVKVPVEVDITYVNKTWFTFKKPVKAASHYVIGFFQRGFLNAPPKCTIYALRDNSVTSIKEAFLRHVVPQTSLYAEENVLPECIKELYDIIEFKIHDVNNEVHVNNMKNAWKDLKRQLKTVHISVSKKHLQSYCNEVAWRINHKHLTPTERFNWMLSHSEVKDHKTAYKNLIK